MSFKFYTLTCSMSWTTEAPCIHGECGFSFLSLINLLYSWNCFLLTSSALSMALGHSVLSNCRFFFFLFTQALFKRLTLFPVGWFALSFIKKKASNGSMVVPHGTPLIPALKRQRQGGWWDGSVIKSTDCSSKGLEFNSQQPHGGSQPSVRKSDGLFWSVWR